MFVIGVALLYIDQRVTVTKESRNFFMEEEVHKMGAGQQKISEVHSILNNLLLQQNLIVRLKRKQI